MAKEDLIPFNQLTEEKQKELASKGGIASGEARRRKRTFREIFEMMLEEKSIDNQELTNSELMALEMIKKAHKGSEKAFEVVRDTVGQRPIEEQKIDSEVKVTMDKSVEELSK